jgi:hypothetical protein
MHLNVENLNMCKMAKNKSRGYRSWNIKELKHLLLMVVMVVFNYRERYL